MSFHKYLLLSLLFIISSCQLPSNTSYEREYTITIMTSPETILDSVIVHKISDQESTRYLYNNNDIESTLIDSITNKSIITIPIQSTRKSNITIKYSCYSDGVVIAHKHADFIIDQPNIMPPTLMDTLSSTLINKYNNVRHPLPDSLNDSLNFKNTVENNIALLTNSAIAIVFTSSDTNLHFIYQAFKDHNIHSYTIAQTPDTIRFLTALKDSAVLHNHPIELLFSKLLPSTDTLSQLIASLPQYAKPTEPTNPTKNFTFNGSIADNKSDVSSINIIITGDSLQDTILRPTSYDPLTGEFNGLWETSSTSEYYNAEVHIYNPLNNRTGFMEKGFNITTPIINFTAINPWNTKPSLTLQPHKAVKANDTIQIDFLATDTLNSGTVESIWLKHGMATQFQVIGNPVQLIVPNTPGALLPISIMIIDNDSNTAIDSITVKINTPPVILPQQFMISENSLTSFGPVIASDTDNDALRFTIHDDRFIIDSITGMITPLESFDFEQASEIKCLISVHDSLESTADSITLSIQNTNDTPLTILNKPLSSIIIQEDQQLTDLVKLKIDTNESSPLIWNIQKQSSKGNILLSQNGILSYKSDTNATGLDSVLLSINYQDTPLFGDTISIYLDITPVDDPSVFTQQPILSGNSHIDSTLTINNLGCNDIDSDITIEYQWYRTPNSSFGGIALQGANANTYTITTNDFGYYLYALVTCNGISLISEESPSVTGSLIIQCNPLESCTKPDTISVSPNHIIQVSTPRLGFNTWSFDAGILIESGSIIDTLLSIRVTQPGLHIYAHIDTYHDSTSFESAHSFELGDFRLFNEAWGSRELACDQAIYQTSIETSGTLLWNFSRDICLGGSDRPDHVGIQLGTHGYGDNPVFLLPNTSSTTILPIQISNINSLMLDIENLEITSENDEFFAHMINLVFTTEIPSPHSHGIIYSEMPIFLNWNPGRWACDLNAINPSLIEEIKSNQITFDLCHQYEDGYRYFQFRHSNDTLNTYTGAFSIQPFINYAINTAGFPDSLWLSAIELKSEINNNASGSVSLDNISVHVNDNHGRLDLLINSEISHSIVQ
ncbi:MAG: cadherin repeat domain-containing protein [Fibrobacterales bacterium]